MRLIDADALVKELSGKYIIVPADEAARGVADFMGIQTRQAINNAPTIEAVPLEDYRSMEQTVHKLTQALAEAEPRWIPCSERLPEKSGRYLVTRGLNACGAVWNRVYIINYSDLMGLKSERIWWDGNVGKSDFERIDDVTAWMPLPEPYKMDEVEE